MRGDTKSKYAFWHPTALSNSNNSAPEHSFWVTKINAVFLEH